MKPRTILIYVPPRFRSRIVAPRVINSFTDRVRPVLEKLDETASFGLHYAAPLIRVFPSPDLDCQREVTSTFLDEQERQAIRIVASDSEDNFDPLVFAASKLCITIRLSEDRKCVEPTASGVKGCEIFGSPDDLLRVLTDIQFDLAFGNSEAFKPLIARAVRDLGQEGFYRLKADFFRVQTRQTYLGPVSAQAAYAPLSALAWEPGTTNGQHRDALVQIWDKFAAEALGQYSLPPSEVDTDVRGIARFGRQLKASDLRKAVSRLSAGPYRIAVLRRSPEARKSPAIRGVIKHLFGPNAALGSFIILADGEEIDSRHRKGLVEDGWIAVQRFYLA